MVKVHSIIQHERRLEDAVFDNGNRTARCLCGDFDIAVVVKAVMVVVLHLLRAYLEYFLDVCSFVGGALDVGGRLGGSAEGS